MRSVIAVLPALLLAACASYGGRGLVPGDAEFADVLRVMGEPTMRWQEPDGSLQLAYPRGPAGVHTFMVRIGSDGKLQRIENVLDTTTFVQLRPGMSEDRVLQILGPPYAGWTSYFKVRDERIWEWRYCDDMYNAAHFSVLFDATSRTLRTTASVYESCGQSNCACTK